jgi:uncharacterized membrane protein YphA (DoxX/SURF4 family)
LLKYLDVSKIMIPTFRRRPAMKTTSKARSSARTPLIDPGRQAFLLLRTVFTVAPILFGLDKFSNILVDWTVYLAPVATSVVPLPAQTIMYIVGVVEIIAGIAVAVRPRFGSLLVGVWLFGIIINLLILGSFYDVALRDFGLLVAALALNRLSPAGTARSRR